MFKFFANLPVDSSTDFAALNTPTIASSANLKGVTTSFKLPERIFDRVPVLSILSAISPEFSLRTWKNDFCF